MRSHPMSRTLIRALLAVALLSAGRLLARSAEASPTFSTVAPGIEVSPGPGEMVESGQAIIARLSGDLALPGPAPVSGWIDTMALNIVRDGPQLTICFPPTLTSGLHRVRLVLPALVGKPREVSWAVQLPAPLVTELRDADVTVTHSAKRTRYEGDALDVTVTGPAGGRATATLGNIAMPLAETSPGTYAGSHVVTRVDRAPASPVRVRITLPSGRVAGNRSNDDAKVFGQAFTVRVDEPVNGSKVPFSFVIRGRTRPNARVSISPSIGVANSPAQQSTASHLRPSSTLPGMQSTGMGGWDVRADAQGRFEQKFGFPIRIFDISYSFVLTATDDEGQQAIPSTLYVTLTSKPEVPSSGAASPSPSPSSSPAAPARKGESGR